MNTFLPQKTKIVIGIDPDVGKNGVAMIDKDKRTLTVSSLTFPQTLEYVKDLLQGDGGAPVKVFVEAGWLNHGNWHVQEGRNGHYSPAAYAAAVGQGMGACHEVSKKLIECFEFYGVPVVPFKPLRKCWRGKDRKITHAELAKEADTYRINFKDKRTNQEERDAALIALVNM